MPDLPQLSLFVAAGWLLNLTPGPDVLYIVNHALRGGVRPGMVAALGIVSGCFVHVVAAAVGVSALLATSATAFTVLKWVGAAYLVFMGVRLLRSRPSPLAVAPALAAPSLWRIYQRGFLTNVLNPKVALFFLALLPQFVVPGQGPVAAQIAWFGFVFIVATLITFGGITYFAGVFGERLQGSPRAQRWMNRASALVFAGLALRLATAQR